MAEEEKSNERKFDWWTQKAKNVVWWVGIAGFLIATLSVAYTWVRDTDKTVKEIKEYVDSEKEQRNQNKYVTSDEMQSLTENFLKKILSDNVSVTCDSIELRITELESLREFKNCN